MIKRFAAIEVGSFELEMGIYEISQKQGIKRIDHIRHTLALGRDTYATGRISYASVEEMCRVLKDFKRIMEEYQTESFRAYGSTALREAKNNLQVLDQIKVKTGLDVHIISNSEQRFIGYMAIGSKGERFENYIKKSTAIADIGYGSMQLTLYDDGAIVNTQNLPLGVLRLREMVAGIENIARKRYQALEDLIDNDLNIFKKIYLKDRKIKTLIGIGEPILYLLGHLGRESQYSVIGCETFSQLFHRVKDKNPEEIENLLGISHSYAQIILPTLMIYQRVLEIFGAREIWLPGTLSIDGIAAEYALAKKLVKSGHDFHNDIVAASRNIAKKYRGITPHIKFVEETAMSLFDALGKAAGLNTRDRLLTQISAILYNCGSYISMRNCAQATYHIVSTAEIMGISHDERMLVAQIAGGGIEEDVYGDIKRAKLSAIIQLADALDRSGKQKIQGFSFKPGHHALTITACCSEDIPLELMAFEKHREYFREIFGLELCFKQRKIV